MSEPELLGAKAFRAKLVAIAETPRSARPPHVLAQTRVKAEGLLASQRVPEGTTVTFYDEERDDAYCLCEVRGGELVIVAKTFANLLTDDLAKA